MTSAVATDSSIAHAPASARSWLARPQLAAPMQGDAEVGGLADGAELAVVEAAKRLGGVLVQVGDPLTGDAAVGLRRSSSTASSSRTPP
jgi:hypothetical protein